MIKFVNFIGELGPDFTWLKFLKSLCSCQGASLVTKQQEVLQVLYDQGKFASKEDLAAYKNNRVYLLGITLGDVISPFPDMVHMTLGEEGISSFLGKSLVQDGIRDILVKWPSNDEVIWTLGMDEVYL